MDDNIKRIVKDTLIAIWVISVIIVAAGLASAALPVIKAALF